MHKILVLPGDGIGPRIMSDAVKVVEMATDEIEFVYGDVGLGAYERTGLNIPRETRDLIQRYDEIACGPVIENPVPGKSNGFMSDLITQLGLYARKRFFKTLAPDLGVEGLEYTVWSPSTQFGKDLKESPSIEGMTLNAYVRSSTYVKLLSLVLSEMEIRKKTKVTLISRQDVFPKTSRIIEENFQSFFPDEYYEKRTENISEWVAHTIKNPFQEEFAIADNFYNTVVESVICGLTGYDHLFPDIVMNNQKMLVKACRVADLSGLEEKYINPTSAIICMTELLFKVGMNDVAKNISDALSKTYAEGNRTPDVGGKLTSEEFISCVTSKL